MRMCLCVCVCVFIVVWLSRTQSVSGLVGPRICSGLNYLYYYWTDYTFIILRLNHTHFNYPWLVLLPQHKLDILFFLFYVFTIFGLIALQFCTSRGATKVRKCIKKQTDLLSFTFINQSIRNNHPESAERCIKWLSLLFALSLLVFSLYTWLSLHLPVDSSLFFLWTAAMCGNGTGTERSANSYKKGADLGSISLL